MQQETLMEKMLLVHVHLTSTVMAFCVMCLTRTILECFHNSPVQKAIVIRPYIVCMAFIKTLANSEMKKDREKG
jgi:hypothetical protein